MKRLIALTMFFATSFAAYAEGNETTQTAAGAQKFLGMTLEKQNKLYFSRETLPDGPFSQEYQNWNTSVSTEEWDDAYRNRKVRKTYKHTFAPYVINSWTPQSDCKSEFTISSIEKRFRFETEGTMVGHTPPPYGAWSWERIPEQSRKKFGIDWQYVSEVKSSESSDVVKVKATINNPDAKVNMDVTMVFEFASISIASRAAYAMEFLRIKCDSSSSTGF